MLLMTGALVAPAANADLTHRLSTSTQLTVEGAFTSGYERLNPLVSVWGMVSKCSPIYLY